MKCVVVRDKSSKDIEMDVAINDFLRVPRKVSRICPRIDITGTDLLGFWGKGVSAACSGVNMKCQWCNKQIPRESLGKRGRPTRTCSDRCRKAVYRIEQWRDRPEVVDKLAELDARLREEEERNV